MALSVAHRLEWLEARIAELTPWRLRSWQDLEDWTLDGEPIGHGDPWPDRSGLHRFAHPSVSAPAEWDEVWLQLDLGGEGLVRLGEEQFAVDAEHREFPVGHGPFPVEVEIVARLPFGKPNRDPRLTRARLVWLDAELDRLVRRLTLIHEMGEHEAAGPAIDAAAAALRELRWPSATAPYVARHALEPDPELLDNVWELPVLEPSPPGLDDDARASVRAAHETLDRGLARVAGGHPATGALLLTGHAHIDLAWRWPLEETRRKAQRTLSTALRMLERHPEMTFNQSTAQLYAYLEEDDPALLERLVEAARDGRFEPIGGMWVEPDAVMPTGESLARQLLYGQRYFRSRFGAEHTVCWMPDCFGFTPGLPQLLASAGITRFFTIKLSWSETNAFPYDLFWWEGLDGTRVLAHMFENPEGGYNGEVGPRATGPTWRNFKGKDAHGESLLSIGFGDGGGGPTEEMIERVRELDGFPLLPTARFGRVDAFFDRAQAAAAARELPVWSGELYLELHRGTLTTQGRTKRAHRRAERDLVAAEALSGLSALAGAAEGSSLEPLWRVLLRNEFHDILPGSSIREVYEDAERELGEVIDGAGAVIDARLDDLGERLSAAAPPPSADQPSALLVVNPDLSARPLRAELPSGPVTVSRSIAGLEAAIVPVGEPAGALSVTADTLENDLLRVRLAGDGTLASVFDKRAQREVLEGPGNQIWAYVDKPREYDAWEVDASYPTQGEHITGTTEVIEDGPHRVAIRVTRRFRDSTIVQDVRLWAGSPRIDFHTRFDWHDRRFLVKARFPLAVRSSRATFETAFGVVERATHRNTSWEQARFEVAGHRFADLSEPGYGVALLNDGRYGHHAEGSELGLSLLRSPLWPDPLADEGEQELVYSLLPHAGSWLEGGVLAEAEDLNRPLLVRAVSGEEGSLRPLVVDGLPVALGALKVLEDGGGLALRVWEPQGARGTVDLGLPEGWRIDGAIDLLERPAGSAEAPLRPFEVRSYALRRC